MSMFREFLCININTFVILTEVTADVGIGPSHAYRHASTCLILIAKTHDTSIGRMFPAGLAKDSFSSRRVINCAFHSSTQTIMKGVLTKYPLKRF
jgi:hypothetical protein